MTLTLAVVPLSLTGYDGPAVGGGAWRVHGSKRGICLEFANSPGASTVRPEALGGGEVAETQK